MTLSTSLNGLKNAQTELNVIANNLANAETAGFKKSRVNFADIVAGSAYTNPKLVQGIGSTVKSIDQNFSTGAISSTGSALDMAINGEGFYTTKSAITGDVAYTRNGNFTTDGSGYIVDQNNNHVQLLPYDSATDTYGSTTVDGMLPKLNAAGAAYAGVQVKTDGSVIAAYADGTVTTIGKVALASFVSPSGLLPIGNQSWQATGISGPAAYNQPSTNGMGNLLSGSLESSNVDMAEEMVGLITSQRFFQANAKAIDTATQIADAVINLRG